MFALFISFHNVCGKVLLNCGKVMILMCWDLVILASSLSRTRRNVKGAEIKNPKHIFAKLSVFLINTDWKIDNIPSPFYTNKVTPTESIMSVAISQAQKQRYRITLDLEVMEDFDPHQIDWENLFELEGNERLIDSYVEDLSVPMRWWQSIENLCQSANWSTSGWSGVVLLYSIRVKARHPMTVTTITVDLSQSVKQQWETIQQQIDAVHAEHQRTDLIKAIRILCAEAVGCTSTGRDMFPAVVAAATSGTMAGVKAISGHTGGHSYVAAEHRAELRTLTAELYALSWFLFT